MIEGDGEYTITEGILTFSFVDGNGDIGFIENSDTAIDIKIPDIILIEYNMGDSIFSNIDTIEYLLPYFNEGVYRKHIKGEIDINLPRTIFSNDTVYYEFYIFDRAGHKSNIEITPEIIYSELLKQ